MHWTKSMKPSVRPRFSYRIGQYRVIFMNLPPPRHRFFHPSTPSHQYTKELIQLHIFVVCGSQILFAASCGWNSHRCHAWSATKKQTPYYPSRKTFSKTSQAIVLPKLHCSARILLIDSTLNKYLSKNIWKLISRLRSIEPTWRGDE